MMIEEILMDKVKENEHKKDNIEAKRNKRVTKVIMNNNHKILNNNHKIMNNNHNNHKNKIKNRMIYKKMNLKE
jgi:hypothetical protein